MKNWREALEILLHQWRDNPLVTGALVCGSYITGNPSKHSDIDVHMLLSDDLDWRERGNKMVDGYLVEYFINPPLQIRKYFAEDFRDHRTISMVQFLTGQVLWDKAGIIGNLKREAQEWMNKPYEAQSETVMELRKYAIWDMWDNLKDCAEQSRGDLLFVYLNSLQLLFYYYCEFLRLETIPYYQILAYLSDPNYIDKYLKKPFPDMEFANLFIKAMQLKEATKMMPTFNCLTEYILQKMGDFQIDGWKVTSAAESV